MYFSILELQNFFAIIFYDTKFLALLQEKKRIKNVQKPFLPY